MILRKIVPKKHIAKPWKLRSGQYAQRFHSVRSFYHMQRIQQSCAKNQLMHLKIFNIRISNHVKWRLLYRLYNRLIKHTASLNLMLSQQPGYVKKYKTKLPRYYRGLPRTIEEYERMWDYKERQKLVDEQNQELFTAFCTRLQEVTNCLQQVVDANAITDEELLKQADELLKDNEWNPYRKN